MLLFSVVCTFTILAFQEVSGVAPKFRVLAPQFICPKDETTPLDKPDNTVITIQTAAGAELDITWVVRWSPLTKPSQRFTLMLWKTIRALEAKLNSPQLVPFIYAIENEELLHGVDYRFTVNAVGSDGEKGTPTTFHIDNSQGDQKLDMIEGRADLLSIILVGGEFAYVDVDYVLEAQVTACFATQDYYFKWSVHNIEIDEYVDVSHITGSRLAIPPYSLKADSNYDAKCEVIKPSTGYRITQTGLHFQVLHRGIEVYLSVDFLMVAVNHAFAIETKVINHDYSEHPVSFNWDCLMDEEVCENFESINEDKLTFVGGLRSIGQYKITVTATVLEHSATASAIITTMHPTLPVLQISPLVRILNEGSTLSLVANASNVAPTCTLTWYFATEEYLSADLLVNETCDGCQHGEALSETLTIFSLEENFLTELTDFTNETEWRQVLAHTPAATGRARFVAQCGCSLTFECETKGSVHADLFFKLNERPKAGDLMISPESGSALETIFRISTLAVLDPDTPLRYSFYCRTGSNDTIMLASYLEHLAVETLLPYIEDGTELWVEVCDAPGACSLSEPKTVSLSTGDGSTVDTLIEDTRAHVRRCETIPLRRVAVSAIVTYTNAAQPELLSRYTRALHESLSSAEAVCVDRNYELFSELLLWLNNAGVYTNGVLG